MTEKRIDRAAAAGKFCVWLILSDRAPYRLPGDFDSDQLARNAAAGARGQYAEATAAIAYNDNGLPIYVFRK